MSIGIATLGMFNYIQKTEVVTPPSPPSSYTTPMSTGGSGGSNTYIIPKPSILVRLLEEEHPEIEVTPLF
jgi:hypothetical protein